MHARSVETAIVPAVEYGAESASMLHGLDKSMLCILKLVFVGYESRQFSCAVEKTNGRFDPRSPVASRKCPSETIRDPLPDIAEQRA
jgi:hypothetical protein